MNTIHMSCAYKSKNIKLKVTNDGKYSHELLYPFGRTEDVMVGAREDLKRQIDLYDMDREELIKKASYFGPEVLDLLAEDTFDCTLVSSSKEGTRVYGLNYLDLGLITKPIISGINASYVITENNLVYKILKDVTYDRN